MLKTFEPGTLYSVQNIGEAAWNSAKVEPFRKSVVLRRFGEGFESEVVTVNLESKLNTPLEESPKLGDRLAFRLWGCGPNGIGAEFTDSQDNTWVAVVETDQIDLSMVNSFCGKIHTEGCPFPAQDTRCEADWSAT